MRLGNLDARRDLTYVDDTVAGFLAAGKADGVEGKAINLGTGSEVSVRELADNILKLVGKPVRIELDASRLRPEKSEVQRLLSDNKLAAQLLGWHPTMSLVDGLKRTIGWVSNHLDLYDADQYIL